MSHKSIAALLGVIIVAGAASAQTAPRLRWQAGQTLIYKVDQSIAVTESVGDNKVETNIKLNSTKCWKIIDVDANGVATIEHSLLALKQEMHNGDGKTMTFDSANPDAASPELKETLSKFVGAPLAVLRVDGQGRVVEVKESKFGSADRYESELPFAGVLPASLPNVGEVWDRSYNVAVDPKGEKFPFAQHYACKSVTDAALVTSVTTEVKRLPEAVGDQVPLLQMQPEGEIVFDRANGRLQSVTLKIDKELKGFQGENSAIHVVGTYVEQYAGDR